ncbi:MAG: hypothetical protein MUC29_02835 [Pyrinomonadaceae bacterium]|jgi:hypothetical protein|nr:hypothetical protein [Pyrinomonadaceae bacterium]
MVTAKVTVLFYILLSLMAGGLLTVLPWFGWGGLDQVFKGFSVIDYLLSSGWFRGAISGLGVLNIVLAFLELASFTKNVQNLESQS